MSSIRCGFIGLGKLGLPVALAINSYGFDVCGTDLKPEVAGYLINRKIPYKEELADDLLKTHTVQWYDSPSDVIRNSDVIFMPVQTPHEERYEGTTRLPQERKDFDYFYLINAVKDFRDCMKRESDPSPKTLVIISTVLPGTIRREIIPLIKDDDRINLVYNPFFIAMGTTIHDFLNPEFVLLGVDNELYPFDLITIYGKIYHRYDHDFYQVVSIESAELTKVAYNTFITSKICIVNTLMEICHEIPGANIDEVTGALKKATKRIVSPMYMNGGMGDGGGCHPRDNIAMSWLAKNLGLSYDWFENLMISREKQAELFVSLIEDYYKKGDYVIVLGYEFKPETNLIVGSHALLVCKILEEAGLNYKKLTLKESMERSAIYTIIKDVDQMITDEKLIFFIGCKHEEFKTFIFPSGSIIIDPFRFIPDQAGCKIIRIGE
jgi:UDPglucose 6-dehydrogenase